MSLDYSRRDCAKCRNPEEVERYSPPGKFFECPECGRRYERAGADAVAADGLLKNLLGGVRDPTALVFKPTRRRKKRA